MLTAKKSSKFIKKSNSGNNASNNKNSRSLNLNDYYKEYKNSNSEEKGKGKEYSSTVSNALETNLSEIYGLDKTSDDYSRNLENIYKQIALNNKTLFENAGYKDIENLSVQDINDALADLSWDGKNNDIITLPDNIENDHSSDKFELNLNEYYKDNEFKKSKKRQMMNIIPK